MTDTKKVLFLPAWYPNKNHWSEGSFVRNHARAINEKLKVDVFHICGDEELKQMYRLDISEVDGVGTYVLYYRKSKSKNLIAQLSKGILYVFGQFYGYYQYRRVASKPDFFHVHVLTRAAILPYVLKLFNSKIKYFITEHWSRYLPQDNSYQGFLRKFITKSVVNKSSGITAVSESLKLHMNRHGLNHPNFKVISNVTRDVFFTERAEIEPKTKHFVHVSNFAANCKNVLGIIEAFSILKSKGYSFSLKMVGDGDDFELAKEKASQLGLDEVLFTGFLYGDSIIDSICESEALVLFSNYETQSVVVTESLSLGVPVIATMVGGVPEMVDESNGILVEPKDVKALSEAVKRVITEEVNFDREGIKKVARQKFKSDIIAQQFIEFYRQGGINI